jgi:Protein of unknown function (DUF2909)
VKIIIAVVLIGIVASLGQALFAMTSGPDQSGRVVKALTVRIGLSLALFVALMIGWKLGLIEPLGTR